MACPKCKGRGWFITDVLAGSSKKCDCMEYPLKKTTIWPFVPVPTPPKLAEISEEERQMLKKEKYAKGYGKSVPINLDLVIRKEKKT